MGSSSSEGLSFNLFVPARFGALDVKSKYHHVMRCCPACGAQLVLFREKFGGRSPRSPGSEAGSSPPQGGVSGVTGGWVCTKCGIHIVPTPDRTQSSAPTSPDDKKPSDDQSAKKSSSKPNSREASPHRSPDHQGSPGSPGKQPNSATSPTSPKAPVVLDDDYEVWERQVKNAFMAFLNQIRGRLGHKETSLKQYQVTLCQRERTLRSNEETMQQRINKIKQGEQNFRTKMDRLNLYKETMIHQLEAKAKQLTQYEQRLRNMDFRSSHTDMRGSVRDIRVPSVDYRQMKDALNSSVSSARNTSADSRTANGDVWNVSAVSDNKRKVGVTSLSEGRQQVQKSPEQWNHIGSQRPTSRPEVTDARPAVAPPAAVNVRGSHSQSAMVRDFLPTGATSANINQIYTRDGPGVYSRPQPPQKPKYSPKQQQQQQQQQKQQQQQQKQQQQQNQQQQKQQKHYINSSFADNSNYMYDKKRSHAQENAAAHKPTSPNGSVFELRTKQSPLNPASNGSVLDVRTKLPRKGQPTSPSRETSSQRWSTQANLHVANGPTSVAKPHVVTSFIENDSMSLSSSSHQHHSPSDRERSTSGLSDLSPTYTTSGYASDRDTSVNGGRRQGDGAQREAHNVSFDDVLSTSSPQNTVDTRPPWMKRRSRRLTEV